MAYRESNKSAIADSSNGQKEKTTDDDQDEEATFNRQYSERRDTVATIKQRLQQAGGHDPKRAVTDPEYYIEGAKISQWPETFEFAVFNKDNDPFSEEPQPTQIKRRGKVNGIRPDYLGVLSFGVEFEGIRGIVHLRDDDNNLLLTRPRAFYEAAIAMAAVYDPRWLEERDDGIDIDDMSHRGKWFVDHPVYPNWISWYS